MGCWEWWWTVTLYVDAVLAMAGYLVDVITQWDSWTLYTHSGVLPLHIVTVYVLALRPLESLRQAPRLANGAVLVYLLHVLALDLLVLCKAVLHRAEPGSDWLVGLMGWLTCSNLVRALDWLQHRRRRLKQPAFYQPYHLVPQGPLRGGHSSEAF